VIPEGRQRRRQKGAEGGIRGALRKTPPQKRGWGFTSGSPGIQDRPRAPKRFPQGHLHACPRAAQCSPCLLSPPRCPLAGHMAETESLQTRAHPRHPPQVPG